MSASKGRARLPRPEIPSVARLGTDALLDRPQGPHSCVFTACWASLLLQYVHRQAKPAWSDLSMEQLIEEPLLDHPWLRPDT
jgi:hypothetical protein